MIPGRPYRDPGRPIVVKQSGDVPEDEQAQSPEGVVYLERSRQIQEPAIAPETADEAPHPQVALGSPLRTTTP